MCKKGVQLLATLRVMRCCIELLVQILALMSALIMGAQLTYAWTCPSPCTVIQGIFIVSPLMIGKATHMVLALLRHGRFGSNGQCQLTIRRNAALSIRIDIPAYD